MQPDSPCEPLLTKKVLLKNLSGKTSSVLLSRDTTLFRDLSAETAAVCKGANVW